MYRSLAVLAIVPVATFSLTYAYVTARPSHAGHGTSTHAAPSTPPSCRPGHDRGLDEWSCNDWTSVSL